MVVYKKGINKYEEAKAIEYVMSNNLGIYMNQAVLPGGFAPYHGLFVKQNELGDEIYLSRMLEQVQIGREMFDLSNINTSEKTGESLDCLEEFSRYPVPTAKYSAFDVNITRRYFMSQNENLLYIEYVIKNNNKKACKIWLSPALTKRGVYDVKRESKLKLSEKPIEAGVKVTLSIRDKEELYIKSEGMKYKDKPHYISGVNTNFSEEYGSTKTYVEDLYVPGFFECEVKPGQSKYTYIAVSLKDIQISNISILDIEKENEEKNKMLTLGIDNNYHELISMARSAGELNYVDRENKKFVVLDSIPKLKESSENICHTIASIDGNYITLGRYKEAYMILKSIPSKITSKEDKMSSKDKCEAILTYIESINRYIVDSSCSKEQKKEFYQYIHEHLYEYINKRYEDVFMDKDGLLVTDSKKYIKINALWYNSLKILVEMADINQREALKDIYAVIDKVKENIVCKFWDEQNKVLKYEVSMSGFATSDMLYALSLSNPVVYDLMAMKIIDTVFKELYTPYGIRKAGIKNELYDGYVYPYLMAGFVKANLRQNGVTRATQKIAYNLVKELLGEINKQNIGTVKYKYYEKTRQAFGPTINGITNAEMIRLYNMLT